MFGETFCSVLQVRVLLDLSGFLGSSFFITITKLLLQNPSGVACGGYHVGFRSESTFSMVHRDPKFNFYYSAGIRSANNVASPYLKVRISEYHFPKTKHAME